MSTPVTTIETPPPSAVTCASCGHDAMAGDRYCESCGELLAPELSRPRRRRWRLVTFAVAGLVAAAGALSLVDRLGSSPGSASATYVDGSPIADLQISARADDAAELRSGSAGASSVDRIEAGAGLRRPALVSFPIPEGTPRNAHARLRIAHREGPGRMWTLHPGKVRGTRFAFTTRSFSEMQLRLVDSGVLARFRRAKAGLGAVAGLRGQASCDDSASTMEVEVVSDDERRPLVTACVQSAGSDGLVLLKLANQRANGLAMSLPDGAEVRRVQGHGLSEAAWEAIYKSLGSDSVLLPGGGTAAIVLTKVPGELALTADNSAMSTDALIMFASRGMLGSGSAKSAGQFGELAQCAYASAATRNVDLRSVGGLASQLRELWATCGSVFEGSVMATGGALVFGSLKLGTQLIDSIRDIGGATATVHVGLRGGGTIHPASPGFVNRYDLQWKLGEGETAAGVVELGAVSKLEDAQAEGYVPQCFDGDESRAAMVSGRFTVTSTTPGFDVRLIPVLAPKRFDTQYGFFTGESIGSRVTSDDYARIETGDGCPEQRATSSMFGSMYVGEGESFGPIDFKIVYADVYGPESPGGEERLESILLTLDPTVGAPLFGARLTCLSGVGVGLGNVIPVTGGDTLAIGKKYGLKPSRRLRGCR